jgi:cyclic pyranopterin phosphate synthase
VLYIFHNIRQGRGNMADLSHFDSKGNANMVDVSDKDITNRQATATGYIILSEECYNTVRAGCNSDNTAIKKGDVLAVAQIAGIMAVKQTGNLIPLCHTLVIEKVSINFEFAHDNKIIVSCIVNTTGKTGVEMEALTGVSIALLTIYDMCKAIDKNMIINGIHLVEKIK